MAVRELDSPPSTIPILARAGAGLIPWASHLPFLGGGGGEVPDLTLVLDDIAVDRDRLAGYDHVCGFSLRDSLPATYPHILAFPLHLSLLTDSSFPFTPIGLVHIYNRITQHRPITASERLSLRVSATPAEPHPRGIRFSLRTEASVGDQLVWEEVSTNLRRGPAGDDGGGPRVPSAKDLPASAVWKLPGDLGRRYGSVSGDMNPIHLHPLTARLFGFNSAIVHGMWTKARCLGALEPRLPASFTVEAAFKRPILLPATVKFAEEDAERGIRFGMRDAKRDTPHLDGTISYG
jgi:acyl dehydratase